MYQQRDASVPRNHHVDYRDRDTSVTTKIRNVHKVVNSFNPGAAGTVYINYMVSRVFETKEKLTK